VPKIVGNDDFHAEWALGSEEARIG
jgi:hypothetical protein